MLFSLICHDIDEGFELRKQTRPEHLAFLGSQTAVSYTHLTLPTILLV